MAVATQSVLKSILDQISTGLTSAALLNALKPITISATGAAALAAEADRNVLWVQNSGTVTVEVFYTVDGAGNPIVILAPGVVNDDGNGASWLDEQWKGPVWLKAPATGGRALVGSY